jgi:hypothetical protein
MTSAPALEAIPAANVEPIVQAIGGGLFRVYAGAPNAYRY